MSMLRLLAQCKITKHKQSTGVIIAAACGTGTGDAKDPRRIGDDKDSSSVSLK